MDHRKLYGGGNPMKKPVGRPIKTPTGEKSQLTLKIPTRTKQLIINQAEAYGMSLTEYVVTVVERDAGL